MTLRPSASVTERWLPSMSSSPRVGYLPPTPLSAIVRKVRPSVSKWATVGVSACAAALSAADFSCFRISAVSGRGIPLCGSKLGHLPYALFPPSGDRYGPVLACRFPALTCQVCVHRQAAPGLAHAAARRRVPPGSWSAPRAQSHRNKRNYAESSSVLPASDQRRVSRAPTYKRRLVVDRPAHSCADSGTGHRPAAWSLSARCRVD